MAATEAYIPFLYYVVLFGGIAELGIFVACLHTLREIRKLIEEVKRRQT